MSRHLPVLFLLTALGAACVEPTPPEFRFLTGLAGVAGDTVWAWDSGYQRVTSFLAAGGVVDEITFRGDAAGRLSELHRLADGTWLGLSDWQPPGGGTLQSMDLSVVRDTLVLRHLDVGGGELDTIAVIPDDESLLAVLASGDRVFVQRSTRPFGRDSYVEVGASSVITASNDSFQWMAWAPTGAAEVISRVPGLDRPITPDDVCALRDRTVAAAGSEKAKSFMETLFTDFPLPDLRPAFENLVVDRTARVWLKTYEPVPRPVSTWIVFEEGGEIPGRVEMPPGLDVFEIGPDHVLAVWTDELGVPYVVRYPLVWT